MGLPTATVRMRGPDGIARTSTGMGTGPVDAAYKAIDSLVRVQVQTPTPFPHIMAGQSMPAGFCKTCASMRAHPTFVPDQHLLCKHLSSTPVWI